MAKELDMPVVDFDAMAEVYVDTVQDWKDLCADREFWKFQSGMLYLSMNHASARKCS